MTLILKSCKILEENLKEELGNYLESGKDLPVVLLDTGAVIDLEEAVKSHVKSLKEKAETSLFLKSLKEKVPLVVTPYVHREIIRHSRYKRNSHTPEIEPSTFKFIKGIVNESTDFLTRARTDVPLDDARYNVYWISKEACKCDNSDNKNDKKKQDEGFSETDRDILTHAIRLSRSYIEFPQGTQINRKINPVIVFSPDKHIGEGISFIYKCRSLSEQYPGIKNISTRYETKNISTGDKS